MLCTLGFFKRIPDPVHVNGSINQQYEGWYEETMHLISRLKRRGFTVITHGESFFVNDVNRAHSRIRIRVENGIRRVKVFRIMKEAYRNKLKKYDRINDIACGVVNQTILLKRDGII